MDGEGYYGDDDFAAAAVDHLFITCEPFLKPR
jgi:hypothetical protein